MDPQHVVDELLRCVQEIRSGRLRHVVCVYAIDGDLQGGMIRLSREGADMAELRRAMEEATGRVGGEDVIPVSSS